MVRKMLATVATAAVLLMIAPAAQAAQQPVSPTPRAPHPRVAPVEPPLCVTTTWRAKHTNRPKTRPGQVCVLTPGMWLPRSWRVLVVATVGDGVPFLLVQRPSVVPMRHCVRAAASRATGAAGSRGRGSARARPARRAAG